MKRAREGEDEDDGGAIPRAVDAAEEGEDEDATRAVCERVNAEGVARPARRRPQEPFVWGHVTPCTYCLGF